MTATAKPKPSPFPQATLFRGFYGEQNTGDDLFCDIASWGARKHWGVRDPAFISRQLPDLVWSGRNALRPVQHFKGQKLLELAVLFAQHKAVVFAGGSMLHSRIEPMTPNHILQSHMKARKNLVVGAIGASLGPYPNESARQSIRDFLCRFRFLVVRDHRSYEDAMDMQLPFTPVKGFDLAGLMPEAYAESAHAPMATSTPSIGLIVDRSGRFRNEPKEQQIRREKSIRRAVDRLARERGASIRIIVFNGNPTSGDVEVSKAFHVALKAKHKTTSVPYSASPLRAWTTIRECTMIVSTRLHGAMFAYMAKTPFVLVEHHQKCSDFLDDINAPEDWRVGDMSVSEGQALNVFEKAFERGLTNAGTGISPELVARAHLNFSGPAFSTL